MQVLQITKALRFALFPSLLLAFVMSAAAQSTAFTYQGRLKDGSGAANGLYDLQFGLFDAATNGGQHGSTISTNAVSITDGIFTVTLDFGDQFSGANRWLEIGVVTNGGGSFTKLTPRQLLTPTPYAVRAANAATAITAASANSVAAANISGTISQAQLPVSVVTNGASGVNISGTFYGNGNGLTNVALTALQTSGAISWGGFTLSSTPIVGSYPYFVTAADVNGDGKVDLISANVNDNSLSVLTNNGSGGFVLSSSPSVGASPYSVAAADVNGDGKVDLISANVNDNSLSVLTNNGSGGFALSSSLNESSSPFSVAAADVNGDGKVDLISANTWASALLIWINNGSGGFVLSSALNIGTTPSYVVAADVNGDGKLDLISANANANTVSVLTNNGSGGFTVSSSPPVNATPWSVVAAEVNGDGKVDLISSSGGSGTITVLTNNGSGGFAVSATPFLGGPSRSVAAADVNEDGKVDLIGANIGANTVMVFTNNGSGGFGLSSSLGVGNLPLSVVAAEVNGDGKVDLISANYLSNTLSLLFNSPLFSGRFAGDGSGLTSLNAASIASGTLDPARIPNLDAGTITSGTFDPARIPNLDAGKITAGTLSDALLSTNVALLHGTNAFSGTNLFSGQIKATNDNNQFAGTFNEPYLKFAEVTTGTTQGGTANAGTNNWRNFNAEQFDTFNLGATNGAGGIVLPAGTYQCRISAPAYAVSTHQIRLVTASGTQLLYGTIAYSGSGAYGNNRSQIDGQITLTNSTTLRVQHWCEGGNSGNGLGAFSGSANIWGDSTNINIFATAEFWKIK